VLAEACPLGESFTSQTCKLCAWHFGEEGDCCAPESTVKNRAAKQAEKRKKRLENLLVLAGEGSVGLHLPSRLFRIDTCSSVAWMQRPGSGSRVARVLRIRIFTWAVLFVFN